MKKTILLFLLCFSPLFLQARIGHVGPVGREKGWYFSVDYPVWIKTDTTTVPNASTLNCIVKGKGRALRSYPFYHLQQDSIKIDVTVNYKTKDCKNAYLIFTSLDYGENAVSRDTLFLPLSDEMTTWSKTLTVRSDYALSIYLDMESEDDAKYGIFSFTDFDFSSEGTPLSEEAVGYHLPVVNRQDLVEWSDMLHLPFMDKRYLALGETSHGTETYGQLAYEIMKERILHHRCKLILTELPLNEMLYFNRYVKNDKRYNLDYISNFLSNTFCAKSALDFLRWVKTYNASHKNEVTVLGFDLYVSPRRVADQLSLYIRSLNVNEISAVNDLCDSIAEKYTPREIPSLLAMFDRTNLKDVVGRKECELIRYCIADLQNKDRQWSRDLRMPQVVEQVLKHYLTSDATVTFWGHWNHLNYLSPSCLPSSYEDPSMGSFLRKKFGEDYSCIGISSKKCEANFRVDNYMSYGQLRVAPEESIEYQVSKWRRSLAYLPMDKLKDTDVFKMRGTGKFYDQERFHFGYLIPKNRMDGILVVEDAVRGKNVLVMKIALIAPMS